jgi:hypothetical protein
MTVRYSHLSPKHTLAAVELLSGGAPEVRTGTITSTDDKEQIRPETPHAAYVVSL